MVPTLNIVMSVYVGIVILLILAGNSLVICSFAFGSRRMKTYTNYFIVNLAISDLLVGVLNGPYWIYISTISSRGNLRSDTVYKVFQAFDIMLGTISIWNLVSLTVERLVAVKFPAYHFNLSWRPVTLALGLTWCLGFLLAGIQFTLSTLIQQERYIYSLFTTNFALPTVIIIGCYLVILQVARDSATMANKRTKKDMKIAIMILIIIGLFLVSWLPFFSLNITYYNCKDWCDKIPESLTIIFKALHYSNSMMNFLVYANRSPDFRRSFSALIRWKLPRIRSDTLTSVRLRQRAFSNPSNSNDHSRSNGNIANNDTLATPLPNRSRTDTANLTSV